MKKIYLLVAFAVLMLAVLVYAATEEITGVHLENDLTCFD